MHSGPPNPVLIYTWCTHQG